MLSGVWFAVCALLIIGPALLIVGVLVGLGWSRTVGARPRPVAWSLVALTVALIPDLLMLVYPFMNLGATDMISRGGYAPLFSAWQVLSGSLAGVTLFLSLAEGRDANRTTFRGSILLLLIHGAGTLLFFSDSVLAWLRNI